MPFNDRLALSSRSSAPFGPHAAEGCVPANVLAAVKSEADVAVAPAPQSEEAASQQVFWHVHWHALSDLRNFVLQDPNTSFFCLASQPVHHFHDTDAARGFCGYRNMQNLLHACLTTNHRAAVARLGVHIPNILGLQKLVQDAWAAGQITAERTGGISLVGTRKWVGSPEFAALLRHLEIPYEFQSFRSRSCDQRCGHAMGLNACSAYRLLLEQIVAHFCPDARLDSPPDFATDKTFATGKAPLYVQWQGHSVTVVGVCARLRQPPSGAPNRSLVARIFGGANSSSRKGSAKAISQDKSVSNEDLEWYALIFDPSVRHGTDLHRAARDRMWKSQPRDAEALLGTYRLDPHRDGGYSCYELIELLI